MYNIFSESEGCMKLFNANDNLMTQGNIRKKSIYFAIPVFIGQLFQQLYGYKESNLLVSRLLFLAILLDFSLLGVSQAASISSKLAQNFLRERCFAVLVSLFFTNARQKTRECWRIVRLFNEAVVKKRQPKPERFDSLYPSLLLIKKK